MTAAFGRNVIQGKNRDSFLAEGTYLTGPTSLFARWEHVMKDELVGVPPGNYMINKFLGPQSGGTGTVATVGAEWDFSLSSILWYPRSFTGQAPGLLLRGRSRGDAATAGAAVAAAPIPAPRARAASRRAQSWNVGQTGNALDRQ